LDFLFDLDIYEGLISELNSIAVGESELDQEVSRLFRSWEIDFERRNISWLESLLRLAFNRLEISVDLLEGHLRPV